MAGILIDDCIVELIYGCVNSCKVLGGRDGLAYNIQLGSIMVTHFLGKCRNADCQSYKGKKYFLHKKIDL